MNILLILVVAVLLIWAVWRTRQKARKGGGCCGEREETERRVAVSDRNKANYPYAVSLQIGGMTCENCARRVENALNKMPGTWATVSIGDHRARVLTKEEPDEPTIRGTVREAGYVVTEYNMQGQ